MTANEKDIFLLSFYGKKVVRISKEQRYNRCKYSAWCGVKEINNRKAEKMIDFIWDIIIDIIDNPDDDDPPTWY